MEIDKGLLTRLMQGDKAAFESIYWACNSRVYYFVFSLLYDKSIAEDITQSVFLKVWEKHAMIDPEQSFSAYLFTIARHLVYKETEQRLISESALQILSKEQSEADASAEEKIDAESLRSHIRQLVDRLPPARKEIFCLSRYEHLSNKEIASRLSISERTVETQLYRALCYLKKELSTDRLLGLILFLIAAEC